ncbi:MAG TPA: Ldh family oxidoreductase [Anaerolineae bacterium]|nr:Ldh family oxidoreductase [Anaerolineae bacterium]
MSEGQPLKVKAEALRDFCRRIFERLGVPTEDAMAAADVLVSADLRGVDSHGVARLRRYVNGLRRGAMKPRPEIRVVRETPVAALLDGDAGLGQVVGVRAMGLAIEKALRSGVGLVAVRNSNHYGIAGYYAMMALEHDLVGLSMTNASPLVVPTFGREAVLGTNPISVAVPAGSERPFVLDMATSVVPRGKLEVYARRGERMPPGWAVDEKGLPTADPRRVLDNVARRRGGGLLPLGGAGEELGGHKGYGLSLLVDILCGVLAGAAYGPLTYAGPTPNLGHLFGALRVDLFRPLEEFKADMDDLIGRLKASAKAPGRDRIYIHGEKEFEEAERRRREGIPLHPKVVDNLREIGEELGVRFDALIGKSGGRPPSSAALSSPRGARMP